MPLPTPPAPPLGFVPAAPLVPVAGGVAPFVAPAAASAAVSVQGAAVAVIAGVAAGLGAAGLADLLQPSPPTAPGSGMAPGVNPAPSWGSHNGPQRSPQPTVPVVGSGSSTCTSSGFIGRPGFTTWVSYQPVATGTRPSDCSALATALPALQFAVGGMPIGVIYQGSGSGACGPPYSLGAYLVLADGSQLQLAHASGGGGAWVLNLNLTFSTNDPEPIPVLGGGEGPSPWTPTDPINPDTAAPPTVPPSPAGSPAPFGSSPVGLGAAAGLTAAAAAASAGSVGTAQPGGDPVPLAPAHTPAYVPAAVPWISPQTQPATTPRPALAPGRTPTRTPAEPGTAPGTFPSTDPTRPAAPVVPGIGVAPPALRPVPSTPPGQVIPWPGARPIPGTGLAPRPDLPGIAQELGRIERKLEQMNTPRSPVLGPDGPLDLIELLKSLYEILSNLTGGTVYRLDSPCEVNEQGQKLEPIEIEVPGSLQPFGSITARLDALAELLQVHKNLKQPSCKGIKPTGEWVSVQFEEFFP